MAVVDELIAILGYELRGEQNLNRFQSGLDRVQGGMSKLAVFAARGATVIGGALVAATGVAVRNSIRWEQALTDLNAPLNASADVLAAVGDELTTLSEQMPVTREGLAELAGGFARTGVAAEDLAGYAQLAAEASVAWEMGAAETGNVMAELANVYQLNQEGLRGLADTINHLANNYATTGEKLTLFLSRASAAASMLGMTDDEIAGIGAGLTAMGIRASTAGDAMTKMAAQIMGNGPGVSKALDAMGLTIEGVQAAFQADGPETFLHIFEKIAELPVAEQTEALKALFGQEYMDDFGKVVNNLDLMRRVLIDATDEGAKLGSVTQEYLNQVGSIGSKWQILKNNIVAAGDAVGGSVLPYLHRALDASILFMQAWNETGSFREALAAMELPAEFQDRIIAAAEAVGRIAGSLRDISQSRGFQIAFEGLQKLGEIMLAPVVSGVEALATALRGLDEIMAKIPGWKAQWDEFTGAAANQVAVQKARMAPEFHQGRDDYLRTLEQARVQTNERYRAEAGANDLRAALAELSSLWKANTANMSGEAAAQEIVNDSRDQSSHVQVSVTQNVALTEASAAAAGAVAQATGSAAAGAATPARATGGGYAR